MPIYLIFFFNLLFLCVSVSLWLISFSAALLEARRADTNSGAPSAFGQLKTVSTPPSRTGLPPTVSANSSSPQHDAPTAFKGADQSALLKSEVPYRPEHGRSQQT